MKSRDLVETGEGVEMKPYADPYRAGFGLGLVLLAAYALAGRGLGASGAFNSSAAHAVSALAPHRASSNAFFASYLAGGDDWLLYEITGVIIGGFLSALFARRLKLEIVRGERLARGPRLALAIIGGALMGTGAVLARGCTSGLALSGGALLAAGAWIFIIAAFASAYLVAPLVRRAWR